MTTTSSVSSSSTAPTVSTGNAQDVSGLTTGSVTLSLAEAVTTKVQPYLDQATAIQTEINTNQTQIAAYQNMQSLLQALQGSVANLTTEPLQGSNAFSDRTANLSSNSGVAASSILSASVAPGTTTGSHTVTVNQIAQVESDATASLAVGANSSIGTLAGYPGDGTVTIAETGKTGAVGVAINSAMTLSQVAAAINQASSTNGVTATVVSVDSSHQVLVLTGNDADTPLTFTDSANPGILQSFGLISSTLTGTASNPTATAGSFTINSGGQSATVTVNAGDSLSTIAANINTAASGTNIVASVVNNQLQIEGNGTNPVSFSNVSGTALATLGFSQSGAVSQATAPQAAVLTVDGVGGITRTSNTISDVLSGVTLNLTQASPSTQVTMQIAPDTAGATTAINNFITAYNNWESFVQQNEATSSSGTAATGAVLFGDETLREASLQIDNSITQEISGTSLAALGISLNSANQLVVDSTTLSQQLTSSFSTVANFFQSAVSASSGDLQANTNGSSTFNGSFTLGISSSNGNITGLTLNGGSAAGDFTFSGNLITGNVGTPYEGLYFTFSNANATNEQVTVTASEGMANSLYTTTTNYGDPNIGTVQTLVNNDQNQNLNFTNQYNNLIDEANSYADFLVQQYSSMTTQIQNSGQTLSVLNALFTAQYSGNG
jgi:flagellar hook-associated protein 2